MTNDTDNNGGEFSDIAGCGRQLRRTREKLGWSLDDAALELRLSTSHLRALEEDDWSTLAGTTYARGYLRSYARLLGLDPEQLLEGASTQEIEISRRPPQVETPGVKDTNDESHDAPQPEPRGEDRRHGGASWAWTGVLAVVAVAALVYWQTRDGALMPESWIPQQAAQDNDEPVLVVEDASPPTDEDTPASTWDESDVPGTPTVPGKVVFQFDRSSWIEVRDARGDRLLHRDFRPGRRVEVQGQPPFRVYLGNARAVQVEYMGGVITPESGSGSERMYARFELGAPSS